MRVKANRKLVCVKTINVRSIPKKERDACKLEVALLKKLDHRNIVGYTESCLTRYSEKLHMMLAIEFTSHAMQLGIEERYAL